MEKQSATDNGFAISVITTKVLRFSAEVFKTANADVSGERKHFRNVLMVVTQVRPSSRPTFQVPNLMRISRKAFE